LATDDQSQLEKSCQALCGLNEKRRPQDRYIITASFDGPNHGSRKIYPDEMVSKKSTTQEMYTFGMAIYVYPVEVSRTIVQLMDVFELYAFGPHHRHPVEKWGAMAFSLGAHSIFMAIANGKVILLMIRLI
jgi:hypothetical protein